jgi:hypothetical protein
MKKFNARNCEELSSFLINEGDSKLEYTLAVFKSKDSEDYFIRRIATRNKVRNLIDSYTLEKPDKTRDILKLDLEKCNEVIERITQLSILWSDAFIFKEVEETALGLNWTKSEEEHKYTSTGIKFWRHQEQMEQFKQGLSDTVISTHISPEGACNLKCPYCSVTYRDTHSRIPLPRIKDYVNQLTARGLKAVILTGGGEPTLYKEFNELAQWLYFEKGLSIGLITNGTMTQKIQEKTLECFSWVRISINIFDKWTEKIKFPYEKLRDDCVVGCSMVYTGEHELSEKAQSDWLSLLRDISGVADKCGAKYIRVLPNCLLEQDKLLASHQTLKNLLETTEDSRYFQQYKIHGAPSTESCHQAHFRPYLSEEPWADGTPGTVYPCDSVVLNAGLAHFSEKYQVCKLEDVGDFLDRKIEMRFKPCDDCSGCVFTDNVNMLEDWLIEGKNRFDEFPESIKHEEFV